MESSYGCLTNSTVVIGAVGIIDSRYFYETQGTGQVTSLIGQKALASFLRLAFTHTDFLTPQWYHSVVQAGDNPSVLGFFIEQMLFSWVSCHECTCTLEYKLLAISISTGDVTNVKLMKSILLTKEKLCLYIHESLEHHGSPWKLTIANTSGGE